MSHKTLLTAFALCVATFIGQSEAQVIMPGFQGPVVMPGQVFPPGPGFPGQPMPSPGFPGQPMPSPGFPGQPIPGPVIYPGTYVQPSVPVNVSPNQITGWNPQTGGLNTANSQLNNTFYDPGRDMSQFNNTRRWVRRPVYGMNGQVTGYQEGWVWNNSFTGQEHGNVQTYTPNPQGGVHQGNVLYSMEPGYDPPTGN